MRRVSEPSSALLYLMEQIVLLSYFLLLCLINAAGLSISCGHISNCHVSELYAQPMRPCRSMRMHPASPSTLDTKVSIAFCAASSGWVSSAIKSIAVLARTTGIIDSPSPVVEQAPSLLSAYKPQPTRAVSPTRPVVALWCRQLRCRQRQCRWHLSPHSRRCWGDQ